MQLSKLQFKKLQSLVDKGKINCGARAANYGFEEFIEITQKDGRICISKSDNGTDPKPMLFAVYAEDMYVTETGLELLNCRQVPKYLTKLIHRACVITKD